MHCSIMVSQLSIGELYVSWNGTDSRAVDLGWINNWRWSCSAGWLLGIHHSNRCKQAKKVQKSTRRSNKNVITRALNCNTVYTCSTSDHHVSLLTCSLTVPLCCLHNGTAALLIWMCIQIVTGTFISRQSAIQQLQHTESSSQLACS